MGDSSSELEYLICVLGKKMPFYQLDMGAVSITYHDKGANFLALQKEQILNGPRYNKSWLYLMNSRHRHCASINLE